MIRVVQGDCLECMKELESNSVDAVVTDPPYGIGFMGKQWDKGVPSVEFWVEMLRVLKPGGHLLAFSGTRTYHRMAVAIEDAGFEIRDMIEWIYSTGFPKSHNIGKSVNQLETNEWTKISKALDNIQKTDIIRVWKSNSRNVNIVAKPSQRQATVAGTHTDLNDSVLLSVVLPINQGKQNTSADTAEIALSVHQATPTRINTVLQSVVAEIRQLQKPVKFAEYSEQSPIQSQDTNTSTAQESVKDTPNENTENKIRVEEALKTLRGNQKYSDEEVINAICVVLTENLLHTILSQSKTFQNLDTTLKMECASVITATITEYTAECLTLYTVDIAKSKAVDKLQGNERLPSTSNVDCEYLNRGEPCKGHGDNNGRYSETIHATPTKGTSEWEGWGTALKPAHEPICMARKPLAEKTVAENCLKWGTGGLNIDASRVDVADNEKESFAKEWDSFQSGSQEGTVGYVKQDGKYDLNQNRPQGRFPANLIHDNSEEVRECFPETKSTGGLTKNVPDSASVYGKYGVVETMKPTDSGNASRFFKSIIYQAKASKSERNKGCEGLEVKQTTGGGGMNNTEDDVCGKYGSIKAPANNNHPTVKPVALMEYLINMVSRDGATILDPFMGSGTTGVACKNLGRNFIGIELDADYIEIAMARIEAAAARHGAE